MMYVAGFIIAFSLLQLLVAFVNIFFAEKLPRGGSDISGYSVSVLIPARNEERNIQNLLNDLIRIKDNWLEIMVLDDQSTDRTADIVRDFAARHERIRCIQSNQLPEGWLGKNHACHQLALNAAGDYLLFLDADVRVCDGLIDNGLRYMLDKKNRFAQHFPRAGNAYIIRKDNCTQYALYPAYVATVAARALVALSFDGGCQRAVYAFQQRDLSRVFAARTFPEKSRGRH